jgi:RNA polymerase sigma-70 factor (ECF subfamily)
MSGTTQAESVSDDSRNGDPAGGLDTERRLLLDHLDGRPEAFGRLVEAYRAPVFSYIVRCGVAAEDRDDLFQEIFVRVHRAAPRYRADLPLHPWLFTIVANAVRNHVRRQKVRRLVFADPEHVDPRDPAPDGEAVVRARQTREWLEGQIARLPLDQREALVLTCVQGLPQRQAAKILNVPLNTLKTRLRRARLELIRRLGLRDAPVGGEVT